MYLTQGLHRALQQTPDAVMTVCGDRQRTFKRALRPACHVLGAEDWPLVLLERPDALFPAIRGFLNETAHLVRG